jgi:hypothetical protein
MRSGMELSHLEEPLSVDNECGAGDEVIHIQVYEASQRTWNETNLDYNQKRTYRNSFNIMVMILRSAFMINQSFQKTAKLGICSCSSLLSQSGSERY